MTPDHNTLRRAAWLALAAFALGCGPRTEPARPPLTAVEQPATQPGAPPVENPKGDEPAEAAPGDDMNLAEVRKDGAVYVSQDKFKDHRIFGYEKPDTTSKKLIVISSATNDVDGNPHQCPLGAFYSSDDMEDLGLTLEKGEGAFTSVTVTDASDKKTTVYVETHRLRFATPGE